MNEWYPSWNTITQDKQSGKQKDWSNKSLYNENTIFKERFDEVFGADTAVGTIGAPNSIYTIPHEIFQTEQEYKDIIENIDKLDKDKKIQEKLDYFAFITLAVFKSLCCHTVDDFNITNFKDIKTTHNTTDIKGWLFTLYMKGTINECLSTNKSIYLLSHGGITYNAINTENYLQNMHNRLEKTDEQINKLKQTLTNAAKFYNSESTDVSITPSSGGYYSTISNNVTEDKIKQRVEQNNTFFKSVIKKINETNDMLVPNADMLFLLMLTTNFDVNKFIDKMIKPQDKLEKNNYELLYPAAEYGPVQPGINQLRSDKLFTCSKKTLYQIIGHIPLGFGATVDKYINKK